jgi:uncharacterized membrane protein YfcA
LNIPFDLALQELIFLGFLVFISASVQGVLGFGFAVIASPIVVQINPSLVPQLLALLGFPLALRVFLREKSTVDWKPMKFLIIGRIIGGPIGLYFLTTLDPKPLSISVGLIVLSAGLGSFFGWNVKRNPTNSFTAGALSGIFGMIAAIGGPPVAILYRGTKGDEFRPSLNAVFTLGIVITLSLLFFTGNLNMEHIILFLYLITPVLLGIRFSTSMFSLVSDKLIADAVTYFSIISGVIVVYRSIF